MKALSILYHDVIENDDFDSSGFPGPAAAHYKLTSVEFEEHLKSISAVLSAPPVTVSEVLAGTQPARLLTFDDGGVSSLRIAERLDKLGWRGHFFITTDRIGKPGFLEPKDIVDLQKRHIIGSHSCSHPLRMSACSWEQLLQEWKRSADRLAQITGGAITFGSVPGGNYSREVGRAAAEAGIKALFTSEPTTRLRKADGCWILGRYGIVRGMSASSAGNLAAGRLLPRLQQLVAWRTKMGLKSIGGGYYDRVREICFGERSLARGRT